MFFDTLALSFSAADAIHSGRLSYPSFIGICEYDNERASFFLWANLDVGRLVLTSNIGESEIFCFLVWTGRWGDSDSWGWGVGPKAKSISDQANLHWTRLLTKLQANGKWIMAYCWMREQFITERKIAKVFFIKKFKDELEVVFQGLFENIFMCRQH